MPSQNRAASTHCPHCGARCRTVKTEILSRLVKEVIYACRNDACGHVFAAHISAFRTLWRSRTPDPKVRLPEGPAGSGSGD